MEEDSMHIVVNWISIEERVILVGATDNQRWQWELEEGNSGADAASIVFVTLTDLGKGIAVEEKAGFHAGPGDPFRRLSMKYLAELFDVAWVIRNEALNRTEAKARFFGHEIKLQA